MFVWAGGGTGLPVPWNYTMGTPSNTLTVGDADSDACPDILVARAGTSARCFAAAAPRRRRPTWQS